MSISLSLHQLVDQGILKFDGERYRLTDIAQNILKREPVKGKLLEEMIQYFEDIKEKDPQGFIPEAKTLEALKLKSLGDDLKENLRTLLALGLVEFDGTRYKLKSNARRIIKKNPLFIGGLVAALKYFIDQVHQQPKTFLAKENKTLQLLKYEGKKAGLTDLVNQLQKAIEQKITDPINKTIPTTAKPLPPATILKTLIPGLVGIAIGYFLPAEEKLCQVKDAPQPLAPVISSSPLPPTRVQELPAQEAPSTPITPKTPQPRIAPRIVNAPALVAPAPPAKAPALHRQEIKAKPQAKPKQAPKNEKTQPEVRPTPVQIPEENDPNILHLY